MSKKHMHCVIPMPLPIDSSPGFPAINRDANKQTAKKERDFEVANLQKQLLSLFFWTQVSVPSKYFWLEDEQVHMRFSKMYTYTNDCEFPLIATAVPILQPMVPCRGYSLFTSVMLKCQLFYKQSRPSKIKGILGSYKIYHVDKGMGLVTSVACREVIEYHTINPNHFSFQRH